MNAARLATALLALALIGGVAWVLLDGGAEGPFASDEQRASRVDRHAVGSTGSGSESEGGREAAETIGETGNTELIEQGVLREVEVGIPAFTGRLLRADDSPAANAEVLALGFTGRVRGYDPQDPGRRPTVRRELQTDRSGRFAIPESPNDGLRWILRFTASAHPTLEIADLGAQPGRTRDLGDIQLAAASEIRGVVLSDTGQPIVAATVEVFAASHGPRLSKWLETDLFPVPDARTETRTDGSFELTELPAGSLRVAAHSPGFVQDYSAAAELEEGAGQEMLEIVLTPSRPLRGIVAGPDGARLADIRIETRWSPIGQSIVHSDASGAFQVDLPEDASEITVRASGPGWAVLRERVSNKVRDEELELKLARVGALHGRVIDEAEAPIARARVALFEQSRQRIARVAPWQLDPIFETETDADGSFSLEVDPGQARDSRYRVVAWTEQHQPTTSRSLQFAQRGENAPAALAEELVLKLEEGLQVTGTVSTADGQPAAGARVHLRRDGSSERGGGLSAGLTAASGDLVAAVTASPRGTFVFQGIAPGDYHLEAMLAGHSPARGSNFALVNAHWQEDLKLLHGCGIRGVVRGDRSGFARLQIIARSEEGRSYPTLVDPDGIFEIPDLPPGNFEVDLYADAGNSVSGIGRRQGPRLSEQQELQVLEGQWTELVFPLEVTELAEIAGMVTLDGMPAADYRVFLVPSGYENSEAERERQFVVDNMRSTHTDRKGRYRFAGLAELRYWVVLAPPRSAEIGGIGGITNNDGPVGLARAELEPDSGERLRHDFALQTARLIGSIIGVHGEREITLRSGVATLIPADTQSGVRRFRVSIDRDGNYAFPPLPAGEWRLDLRSGESRLRTDPFLLAPGITEERKDRLRVAKPKR